MVLRLRKRTFVNIFKIKSVVEFFASEFYGSIIEIGIVLSESRSVWDVYMCIRMLYR